MEKDTRLMDYMNQGPFGIATANTPSPDSSPWSMPGGVMDILKSFKSGQKSGVGIWPGVATIVGSAIAGNPIGVFGGIASMAGSAIADQKARKQQSLESIMSMMRR